MRFYQLQTLPYESGNTECFWFTNRAEAEREKRRLEEGGADCFSIRAFDIPTTKTGLLNWLNNYGNPDGMGFN
jgi:hypothetical protein